MSQYLSRNVKDRKPSIKLYKLKESNIFSPLPQVSQSIPVSPKRAKTDFTTYESYSEVAGYRVRDNRVNNMTNILNYAIADVKKTLNEKSSD